SEHEQSRRHPDASLTVKGFTQLSSAINSESETLAATPKAVKAAYDLANGKYTAQNATTTQKGIVQLSSATNSTSETLAATPKSVKAVMDETNKKAPLNSPALTGTPTTPTAPQGTNSTQIASTAFVMAAIAALVDSSPDALNTLNELAAALGNDPNFATTMTNALAGKQPKDATLTALAELATSADKLPYFTGADRAALTALTSVGRAILGKPSTQGVLDYLGLTNAIIGDTCKEAGFYLGSELAPYLMHEDTHTAIRLVTLDSVRRVTTTTYTINYYANGLIQILGMTPTVSSLTPQTMTFPVAFPNACVRFALHNQESGVPSYNMAMYSNLSRTGVKIWGVANILGNGGSPTLGALPNAEISYEAWGY
ncbi:TPA: tail fiber protein, partial [Escherichia coli]